MGTEGLNTAIEKISDFVQPEFDKKIGFIKDVSAGAVMIVSIAATIIGCIQKSFDKFISSSSTLNLYFCLQ